jgi:hypothetical protein
MSDITVHCIYSHSWLLEQSVLVQEWINKHSKRSQVLVIMQSMLLNLDSLACQLSFLLPTFPDGPTSLEHASSWIPVSA